MKISKSVLITSVSSCFCGLALAGGIEVPEEITVAPHRYTIGGSLLYGQPSTNSGLLEYATIRTINQISDFTDTNNASITNRDYDFGFDVFARYNFINSDRDLTVSYLRFSDTDTDNTILGSYLNTMITPIYNQFYHTAEGSIQSRLDAADLMAGQNMHLGESVKLHFIGGLGFARIKQTFEHSYDADLGFTNVGIPANRANESYYTYNSQFQGMGPKLGIDADYDFMQTGFGLAGGLSAALLMGSLDYSINSSKATAPFPIPHYIYQSIDFDSNNIVVTNLNANVGIRYYCHYFESELGYRVNQYSDAVYDDSNFGLSSFYLKVAVSFL